MSAFFRTGELDRSACSPVLDRTAGAALLAARQVGCARITPGLLLLGFVQGNADQVASLMAPYLRPGASLSGVTAALFASFPPASPACTGPTALTHDSFTPGALAVFKALEEMAPAEGTGLAPDWTSLLAAQHILWAILGALDESDTGFLRFQMAVDELREGLRHWIQAGPPAEPEQPAAVSIAIWSEDQSLRSDAFDAGAWEALQAALWVAHSAGRRQAGGPDLLHGLLAHPGGSLTTALRATHPLISTDRVRERVASLTGGQVRAGPAPLPAVKAAFHAWAQAFLDRLAAEAAAGGLDRVDGAALAAAFLAGPDGTSRRLLAGPAAPAGDGLALDLGRLERWLRSGYARLAQTMEPEQVPTPFPDNLCRSSDLVMQARASASLPLVGRQVELQRIEQGLFRRDNGNVLIVGERGTGRSALVRGFARLVAERRIDFLSDHRLISVDIAGLPEDAGSPETGPLAGPPHSQRLRARLEHVLQIAQREPNLILVFDPVDPVVAAAPDILLRALRTNTFRAIAVTTHEAFLDTFAQNDDLNTFFLRIELAEPTWQEAEQILKGLRPGLEVDYGVQIQDGALRAAARYSSECMLSQRLPRKALDALKSACDEARYASRASAVKAEDAAPAPLQVGEAEVVAALAKRTDLPPSVIGHSGAEGKEAFAGRLRRMVVGQDYAVDVVAERLALIRAGIAPKNKPAGVMLFVGPTATGKSELAKAVAQIYSSTGRLIQYDMNFFREDFSISGLIGPPPGIRGYDEGGALVNQLNADPYAVIVFEEFEKSCVEAQDVLYRLLDEAVITDRRGVSARANHAFIVMTSNEQDRFILDELGRGTAPEEVERLWRVRVGNLQPPRIRREMLSRIGTVVPFGALRPADYVAITRLQFEWIQQDVQEQHGVSLVLEDAACERLAALARADEKGGRGVQGRLERHVRGPAAQLARQARRQPVQRIVFGLDRDGQEIVARLVPETAGAPESGSPQAPRPVQEVNP